MLGMTRYLWKKTLTLTSQHAQKFILNRSQHRAKMIKLLEENIGEHICDTGLGKDFLNRT